MRWMLWFVEEYNLFLDFLMVPWLDIFSYVSLTITLYFTPVSI